VRLRAPNPFSDRIEVTILEHHPFAVNQTGRAMLAPALAADQEAVECCLKHGNLIVDVPIDLQGLPDATGGRFVWELTKRPVDMAFDALPPLADRIGATVARFRRVLQDIDGDASTLGQRVWESYPAASLTLLGLPTRGYKGTTAFNDVSRWRADGKDAPLADVLTSLGWSSSPGVQINDDEFDAILCALTGIVNADGRLEGADLENEILDRLSERGGECQSRDFPATPPRGYVLLRHLPSLPVVVTRRPFQMA
jgi:hypothetical protein